MTMSTEYTNYEERQEKVLAFQFLHQSQLHQVIGMFGPADDSRTDHDTWLLSSNKGKLSVTFPKPKPKAKAKAEARFTPVNDGSGLIYNGTITFANCGEPSSLGITVNEGDWIVHRWRDTDHPEMVVMTDVDFKRNYR